MTEETAVEPPEFAAAPVRWAKVEIMGHRVRFGAVREVEEFGAKFCEIAVYAGEATEPTVERYSGSALFSITPCTEEQARENNRPYEYRRQAPALTYAGDDIVDVDPDEGPF